MRRNASILAATLLIVTAAIAVLAATPAEAASQATATSVALNSDADCTNADLDMGIVSGEVDFEYGLATNANGVVLEEFEQTSNNLDDFDGVFTGYGIGLDPDQPPTTIIGTYAWLGASPPSAATNAEWFVLYRCTATGDNTILYSCFGDYGTCPQTAVEALSLLFTVNVSTITPAPGETITVTGTGCAAPLGTVAGITLLRDSTFIGGGIVTPDAEGNFSGTLTVPADLPPGTELIVRAVCGDGDVVAASADVTITVTSPAPPPTEPEPTTPPDATTRPQFTG